MPSFGIPSSIPVSSSPTSCLSSFLSSNISSCSESSCVPVPDGCMSNLFENPYLAPPPPLALSDGAPYSPPPAYPSAFSFGPPLFSSTRFPPPPNSSFAQPVPNISVLEGPPPHYPSDQHTTYERWSDRNTSTPFGGDNISKCFSHWPLPFFNSGNNPNIGFHNADSVYPHQAPYPPLDSVLNFGSKFSPLTGDTAILPNAPVMPSTSSTSITSPLPSSHFASSPPRNLPFDFPLSSSPFPFNSHTSTFMSNLDSTPNFGPCNAEFIPESVSSYLSPTSAFIPSSLFQAPDYYHDASSRPVHTPETAPRPIRSNSPSCSFGLHPHNFNGSSSPTSMVSHSIRPCNDDAFGPLCSSEAPALHEPSSHFPAPSTSTCPPPLLGAFWPYSSAPPGRQDFLRNGSGEERRERIMGETGKLMYQHMSPEEWRWLHYETLYSDGLEPARSFAKVRPAAFNHFHGVDHAALNSSNGFVSKERSSLDELKSQKEQFDMLERSKAQNQSGPSLKLAASALAEMLALGSNERTSSTSRSVLAQISSTPGGALTSDAVYSPECSIIGGQLRQERLLEDCCSSSRSALVHKEVRDGCPSHMLGGLPEEAVSSGPTLSLATTGNRGDIGHVEDVFCDSVGAPTEWSIPEVSGLSRIPTASRPMTWLDVVPQFANGGASCSAEKRRVFPRASSGTFRQPSTLSEFAKLQGLSLDSSTSENFFNLPKQPLKLSPRPQSGRIRRVCSLGTLSSDARKSAASSYTPKGGPSHQEVPSSGSARKSHLHSFQNGQGHVNSTPCGSCPLLSQAGQGGSMSGLSAGATSRVLANLQLLGPDRSSQIEAGNLDAGFHLLTASISNLSKVLLSLDSSSLTQPDSATLEETLQSSILRLSECLLLEQSRINRKYVGTCFVGSTATDEMSKSRRGQVNGSPTDVDCVDPAKSGGRTNIGHIKIAEDICTRTSAQLGKPNPPPAIPSVGTVDTDTLHAITHPQGLMRKPVQLAMDRDSMYNMGDARYEPQEKPEPGHSCQNQEAVINNLVEFLRDNGILDRSSLERLIGAEEREVKLKVMVEELKEELELERAENRGTALLCEKILQDAEGPKAKATRQVADKALREFKKAPTGSIQPYTGISSQEMGTSSPTVLEPHGVGQRDACNQFQHINSSAGSGNNSGVQRCTPDHSDARIDYTSHDKGDHNEWGESKDSGMALSCSCGAFQGTNQMKSQLSISPVWSSTTTTDSNISHETSTGLESQQAKHVASDSLSRDADQVASRLALLRARSTTPEANNSLEALPSTERVESQVAPLGQLSAALQRSLLIDHVEPEMPFAQARHGCGNDLGVFTETEPCTPDNPFVADPNNTNEIIIGNSTNGLHVKQVDFARRTMAAMSHISSQLLIQSETISKYIAWSQSCLEEKPNTEPGQKETGLAINTSAEAYDDSAVEARAFLIRSRPDWTEDASERETEDLVGSQVCNTAAEGGISSGIVRYESDHQMETLNEISLVRLLDTESQPLSMSHGQQKTDGDACKILLLGFETEEVKGAFPKPQDIEEEAGWEHVLFPPKE